MNLQFFSLAFWRGISTWWNSHERRRKMSHAKLQLWAPSWRTTSGHVTVSLPKYSQTPFTIPWGMNMWQMNSNLLWARSRNLHLLSLLHTKHSILSNLTALLIDSAEVDTKVIKFSFCWTFSSNPSLSTHYCFIYIRVLVDRGHRIGRQIIHLGKFIYHCHSWIRFGRTIKIWIVSERNDLLSVLKDRSTLCYRLFILNLAMLREKPSWRLTIVTNRVGYKYYTTRHKSN